MSKNIIDGIRISKSVSIQLKQLNMNRIVSLGRIHASNPPPITYVLVLVKNNVSSRDTVLTLKPLILGIISSAREIPPSTLWRKWPCDFAPALWIKWAILIPIYLGEEILGVCRHSITISKGFEEEYSITAWRWPLPAAAAAPCTPRRLRAGSSDHSRSRCSCRPQIPGIVSTSNSGKAVPTWPISSKSSSLCSASEVVGEVSPEGHPPPLQPSHPLLSASSGLEGRLLHRSLQTFLCLPELSYLFLGLCILLWEIFLHFPQNFRQIPGMSPYFPGNYMRRKRRSWKRFHPLSLSPLLPPPHPFPESDAANSGIPRGPPGSTWSASGWRWTSLAKRYLRNSVWRWRPSWSPRYPCISSARCPPGSWAWAFPGNWAPAAPALEARGGVVYRRGTRHDDDCGGTLILSECPSEALLGVAGTSRAVPSRAPG